MFNTTSLSSFRPILSTESTTTAPVALELPTDIANVLVHAVCKTDDVAAITSLSMVNRQFRSCARPAMQLLGMRDFKFMKSDRKAWRELYRATEPVYRSLLVRATAREAVRMLEPAGRASFHPLLGLLSFIAAPSGKQWWTKSDEAAATITRAFHEGFLGDTVCKTFKFASEPALLDALADQVQDRLIQAVEHSRELPGSARLALLSAIAEAISRQQYFLKVWYALSTHLQYLELDDQVRLVQRLLDRPHAVYLMEALVPVLQPVESAIMIGSLFEPGRYDRPGSTLWQTMKIYALSPGKSICYRLGMLLDGGLVHQLCKYPYIGIDQVSLPRAPEEAPWPLILLTWLCQSRKTEPAEAADLLSEFKRKIKSGEYQFITRREFRKLTKTLDVDPGPRLQAWMAWRTEPVKPKPGFWSRAKQ